MLKFRLVVGLQILMMGALVLSACGATAADLTPTVTINPDEIRTQAVGTFAADLTLTAFAAPTDTPAATLTPLASFTPAVTSTGGAAFGSTLPAAGGTASCYGLAFVSDVTIPDNTPMTSGQTFTKTWKVRNAGSCAWDAGFKFAFTGGESMGGATFTLPSSVAAGAVYDISVPMTAPNNTGTLRGNWRMSTASGQFFGDEVYVQVVIGGGAAPTNTGGAPAATSTTAPAEDTETPTP
ncbi:MAG TPA: NBR1-Ig-like domain-containing protein [Anaerolineales bacterium]|nr:NBR1-Ig-like domain-containing protein [Anaerolineales bacterium]